MERIGTIVVAPSTERKAEPGRFGAALKSAANDLASGVAGSVALAAPYLPGGAVMAGALRSASPALTYGLLGSGSGLSAGASVPTGSSTVPGPTTAPGGDLMEATRVLQQQAQSFNLQYLQLQESMQRESREFTSLTNVMKVRHDSAKAAIGNIH
jgi:hypothetical protein